MRLRWQEVYDTQALKALLDRARSSGDGEAYAPVAKGSGFRIGMGVRLGSSRDPTLFVEVVLNPFPDRPRVDPGRMRRQSEQVAVLEARGYVLGCDADGTVTCERILARSRIPQELVAVRRLFLPAERATGEA